MGAVTTTELKRFIMLKADEILVNVVARRNLFAVVANLIGKWVEGIVVLEAVSAIAAILPIALLSADAVMECVGEAAFGYDILHAVFAMFFAKTRHARPRDVVKGLLDAPNHLAVLVFNIDHVSFAMCTAEPRRALSRDVEGRSRDALNYLAAPTLDIHHVVIAMCAAEFSLARPRDIEGGMRAAANYHAALVYDVHHVVFAMRTAEPRFVRARDVEVCTRAAANYHAVSWHGS